jgi:hypothetical protein
MYNPASYVPREASGGNGSPKSLDPGTHYCRIVDVRPDVPVWAKNDELQIIVTLEGPDEGDDFEGFPIDPQNPEVGRYRGKIANVRAQRFVFETRAIKGTDKIIERDASLYEWISEFLDSMGKLQAVVALGKTYFSPEQYLETAASYLIDSENWGKFTIGGEAYVNKNGRDSWRLFFPRKVGNKKPFARVSDESVTPESLMEFNPKYHLVAKKGAVATSSTELDGFNAQPRQVTELDLP